MAEPGPRQGTLIGDGMLPDRFRVRQPLGRGSHGRVYLAWDRLHERDVALKLLELGGMEREACLHEARALARVRHPAVVTVYELVHQVERPYLVMEYIEGEELERRLDGPDARPADPAFAVAVGRAVAAALAASHAAGVLHRDVKPSNVLVGDRGVTLIDFGVARRRALTDAGEAGEGGLVGTPLYLAPEQLGGAVEDERSDIYAVGVLLFRLLTLSHPYEARSIDELRQLQASAAPGLRAIRPDLPAPLADVVSRCLAPHEARYPSALALLRDLERAGLVASRPLPEAPYVGLAALTAAHHGVFFGREEEVARVLGRLRLASTVALVGASGAGKSSLAGAGIGPAVEAGALDDPPSAEHRWQIRRVSPGDMPLHALAAEVAAVTGGDAAEVVRTLGAAPERWWRLVSDGGGRRAPTPALLLIVDQLEELVTLCQDQDQRRAFGLALQGSLAADARVRVVITARDDFLVPLGAVPGLRDALETIHIVRPLDGEGLRAAVVEPARAFGYAFEDAAMVERIVGELAGRSAAMPLLGFAMQRLWEGRDEQRRLIGRAALEQLGGIGAALARAADDALDSLRGRGLFDEARRVLLELLTPEGTKRTRTLGELLAAAGSPEGRTAVEQLREARLVSGRGDALELAHEALARQWPLLRRWVEESRARRELAADAGQSARRWAARGRPADLLWRGRPLDEAHALLSEEPGALEPEAAAFVRDSLKAAHRRRWGRRLLALGLLGVVAVGAGIYIRGLALERDLARRQARSERLALQAQRARVKAEQARARAVDERRELLEAWVKERQQLLADLERTGQSGLRQHILRRLTTEGPPAVRLTPPTGEAVEVCLFGPADNLDLGGDWPQKTAPVAQTLATAGYRIGCQYPYVRRAFPAASRHGVIQHAGKLAPAGLTRLRDLLRRRFPDIAVREIPARRLFRTVDVLLPD